MAFCYILYFLAQNSIRFYHVQSGQRNVSIISVTHRNDADIKDIFQDSVNLMEFHISLRHLPPSIGTA